MAKAPEEMNVIELIRKVEGTPVIESGELPGGYPYTIERRAWYDSEIHHDGGLRYFYSGTTGTTTHLEREQLRAMNYPGKYIYDCPMGAWLVIGIETRYEDPEHNTVEFARCALECLAEQLLALNACPEFIPEIEVNE